MTSIIRKAKGVARATREKSCPIVRRKLPSIWTAPACAKREIRRKGKTQGQGIDAEGWDGSPVFFFQTVHFLRVRGGILTEAELVAVLEGRLGVLGHRLVVRLLARRPFLRG